MAYRSRFFDSESGDRVYTADAWAQVFGDGLVTDGVVYEKDAALDVIEENPPGMEVRVTVGVCWIAGRYFQVYEGHTVSVDAADPDNDRKDRVIVQLDYDARTVKPLVKTGTAGTDPDPPPLEDSSSRKELGLAILDVQAGASTIENADITNTRGQSAAPWARLLVEDNTPPGTIRMHDESYAPTPPGWVVCNGNNGTPDLTDRFIVAWGSNHSPGDTGGANEVTLAESEMPSHVHSPGSTTDFENNNHVHEGPTDSKSVTHGHTASTGSDGAHDHTIQTQDFGSGTLGEAYVDDSTGKSGSVGVAANGSHQHTVSVDDDSTSHDHDFTTGAQVGSHTHALPVTDATGGGAAHENRPAYYCLTFIMKT